MKSFTWPRSAGDALALRAREPPSSLSDGNHQGAGVPTAPQGEVEKPSGNTLRGNPVKGDLNLDLGGVDTHTDSLSNWCEKLEDGVFQYSGMPYTSAFPSFSWEDTYQCGYVMVDTACSSMRRGSLSVVYNENGKLKVAVDDDTINAEIVTECSTYLVTYDDDIMMDDCGYSACQTLNGNNGEATNGDDLDHQDRQRNQREARNHRHQNLGGRQNGPTFQNLLKQYQNARIALARIVDPASFAGVVAQATVDDIMGEIERRFPERVAALREAAPPVVEIVVQNVEPEMQRIRVYVMGTAQVYLLRWWLLVAMALLLAVGSVIVALCDDTEFVVVTWLQIIPVITLSIFFVRYRTHGRHGLTPDSVMDSNKTTEGDANFNKVEVLPNTFWAVKGYTHYVDIDVPSFFLRYKEGGVQSVVNSCSTDSQLLAIANATLSKDNELLKEFETLAGLPHGYNFYCNYVGAYVAQQKMFHLYESGLQAGRLGKITPGGWSGSELNFRFSGRIHGVISTGIFRQYFEDSKAVDTWVDNNRFQIVKCVKGGKTYRFNRRGNTEPEFWYQNYGFTVTDHVNQKRLLRYRTKLLTFHNGGILLGRTNINLRSALNRMFTAREKDRFLESELQRNQRELVRFGDRRYGKLLATIASRIRARYDTRCEIDDLLGQLKLLTEPHVKKELRKEAHEYIKQMSMIHEKAYASKVTAKVKIEVAKFLKNARVYVDMTTPQSLLGGWLVDPLKEAMREIDLGWCLFIFAKTTDEANMQHCFNAMRDNEHRPVCVFHSDDAIMQLPCSDGVFRFNLDISSCDRSNLQPIFDFLVQCVPEGPWRFIYERMVQGCKLPLIVPNPSTSGEYAKFKPTGPFEYSGCNLTTVLNNCALLVIASRIFHKFRRSDTMATARDLVIGCAKSVGFLVTVQVCRNVEELQFLKFSPSDSVNWHPVRNLGCVLRAVGHYDGDLPGRGDLYARAHEHVCQVATGITTGYIDPVAAVLRKKFHCRSGYGISNKYQWEVAKFQVTVPLSHLQNRYGLQDYEVQLLSELVEQAGIGDYVTSPILDKIFSKDY